MYGRASEYKGPSPCMGKMFPDTKGCCRVEKEEPRHKGLSPNTGKGLLDTKERSPLIGKGLPDTRGGRRV